jgi:hypothetical protein
VGGAVLFLGAFAVVFALLVVVGAILRRLDAEMSFGHARPMS